MSANDEANRWHVLFVRSKTPLFSLNVVSLMARLSSALVDEEISGEKRSIWIQQLVNSLGRRFKVAQKSHIE